MAASNELVTQFGFEFPASAKSALQEAEKGLENIREGMREAFAASAGALKTWGPVAVSATAAASGIDAMSKETGIAAEELQVWIYAANAAGVSSAAVIDDLARIEKQAAWTGKSVASYAAAFEGLSAAQSGSACGLSPDMVTLLQKGREGVAALKKEAQEMGGLIPREGTDAALEFNRSLSQAGAALRGIATEAFIGAMPAMKGVIDAFREFALANRDLFKAGAGGTVKGIINGFSMLGEVVGSIKAKLEPAFKPLAEFFGRLSASETAMHLVAGAVVALGAAFAPMIALFAAVGALLAAASLAFEDFFVFLNGGKSGIGLFLAAFEEKFPAIFDFLKEFGALFKDCIVRVVELGIAAVKKAVDVVFSFLSSFISGIEKVLRFLGFGKGDAAKEIQGISPEDFTEEMKKGGEAASGAVGKTVPAARQQSTTNNTTNNTTVNVNGAGDPRAVANEVLAARKNTANMATPGGLAPVAS